MLFNQSWRMMAVWGTRSVVMETSAAHALRVLVVIVITLRTTSAQNVCSLNLTSKNCFEPSGDVHMEDQQGKTHAEDHDVSSGSCDFTEGMCESYTQGCRQQNGATKEWTHNASGFLEATFNGGNGRNENGSDATFPTLSSPLLHIRVASCLTVAASTAPSSQLAVWLGGEEGTCLLAVKNTTSLDSVGVFRLNLPVTVEKVVFQGFGKEEGKRTVRLYSVSLLSECCVDKDWSTFYFRRASTESPLSPHCHWEMRGWNSSTQQMWATAFARTTEDTLTSPVLSGNSSPGGHFGCFSFQYFLEAKAGVTVALSVSLLTGRSGQDEVVKWLVYNNSAVSEGTFGVNSVGQLPISLSKPFRIRFTVRSGRDVNPPAPVVIVKNATYTRDLLAPCPYEPHWAEPGKSDSHCNKVVTGSIAGGTSAGLIIVIVVAVCLCVRWRKRQRRAAKVKASVPMTDILQTERPLSFNPYTEIAATADPAPTAHDNGSVSGNPVTSVHDVTTNSDRTESDTHHSSSDLVNPGTKEISNENSSVDPRHRQSNEKSTSFRSQTHENGEAKATNDHTTDESQNHESPESNGYNEACATKASTRSEHHYHVLEEIDSKNTLATQKLKTDSELGTGLETNNKLCDEPETENCDKAGGRAECSSTVYDRLGDIKGGDTVKAKEGALHVYDRVGVLNESVYDVAQRSRRIDVIDSAYHRLDHIPKGKST